MTSRSSKRGNTTEERGWMVYGSLEVLKDRVRSVFFQFVEDRSAQTLIPVIQKYIKLELLSFLIAGKHTA